MLALKNPEALRRAVEDEMFALAKGQQPQTKAQEEYAAIIENLLAERDLEHPFDQDDAEIKAFFNEASRRWGVRRKELAIAE